MSQAIASALELVPEAVAVLDAKTGKILRGNKRFCRSICNVAASDSLPFVENFIGTEDRSGRFQSVPAADSQRWHATPSSGSNGLMRVACACMHAPQKFSCEKSQELEMNEARPPWWRAHVCSRVCLPRARLVPLRALALAPLPSCACACAIVHIFVPTAFACKVVHAPRGSWTILSCALFVSLTMQVKCLGRERFQVAIGRAREVADKEPDSRCAFPSCWSLPSCCTLSRALRVFLRCRCCTERHTAF